MREKEEGGSRGEEREISTQQRVADPVGKRQQQQQRGRLEAY